MIKIIKFLFGKKIKEYYLNDKCYLDYFYDMERPKPMNRYVIWFVLVAAIICLGCCATVIIAGTGTVDPSKITVKSSVIYNYEAKLPDGTVKVITSEIAMTEKAVKEQAAALVEEELKAKTEKQKEIDNKVAALDWKKCFLKYVKWEMYGVVIAHRYRYQLPDGSSNWIDSKVPLKDEECLKVIQGAYRANLTERDGI